MPAALIGVAFGIDTFSRFVPWLAWFFGVFVGLVVLFLLLVPLAARRMRRLAYGPGGGRK